MLQFESPSTNRFGFHHVKWFQPRQPYLRLAQVEARSASPVSILNNNRLDNNCWQCEQ